MAVQILIIDCNDSFTYNLLDYFYRLGVNCTVVNVVDVDSKMVDAADGIVLSPGPGHPKDYPSLLALLDTCHQNKPILGVCLGMQLLAHYFGMLVIKSQHPMHGKTSDIYHDQREIFHKIQTPFNIMRYHSLVVKSVTADFTVTSRTKDDIIMSFRHNTYNLIGVQFHPESVLTEFGQTLLGNWIQFCIKN